MFCLVFAETRVDCIWKDIEQHQLGSLGAIRNAKQEGLEALRLFLQVHHRTIKSMDFASSRESSTR